MLQLPSDTPIGSLLGGSDCQLGRPAVFSRMERFEVDRPPTAVKKVTGSVNFEG